jgi:dipeptidyl aminopeptidase/acylaminoacyl peptidase
MQNKILTSDDLLAVKRVDDPQISPDGNWVAYTIKTLDDEKNTEIGHIWIVSSMNMSLQRIFMM